MLKFIMLCRFIINHKYWSHNMNNNYIKDGGDYYHRAQIIINSKLKYRVYHFMRQQADNCELFKT